LDWEVTLYFLWCRAPQMVWASLSLHQTEGKLEFISFKFMYVYLIPSFSDDTLSIFEIYPKSERPLLTEIAYIDWDDPEEQPAHLLPDTVVYRVIHDDRIVFRIVNYRTNYSTRFSADVEAKKNKYDVEV
jgi:hypothetical protein